MCGHRDRALQIAHLPFAVVGFEVHSPNAAFGTAFAQFFSEILNFSLERRGS